MILLFRRESLQDREMSPHFVETEEKKRREAEKSFFVETASQFCTALIPAI